MVLTQAYERLLIIHNMILKPDPSSYLYIYYLITKLFFSNPPNSIKAAYSFYNVATSVSWVDLMSDALVLAKKLDFDVFNALDLMENVEFLEKLKFGIGDGNLQYYIYNWRCPQMNSKEVGLVLQ